MRDAMTERAFPEISWETTPEGYPATYSQGGMYLVDYFAAAALTGLLANPRLYDESDDYKSEVVEESWNIAQRMIAAMVIREEARIEEKLKGSEAAK